MNDPTPTPAPDTVAARIPARVRGWIYTGMAVLAAAELVYPVAPDVVGRVFAALALLGFATAKANTPAA